MANVSPARDGWLLSWSKVDANGDFIRDASGKIKRSTKRMRNCSREVASLMIALAIAENTKELCESIEREIEETQCKKSTP